MVELAIWSSATVVIVLALLCWAQVPLWGIGPLWMKRIWTRIIRCWKCGDTRTWNWTEIEEGLYVSSLPRSLENLAELQTEPHNLGGVVSLIEQWEVKVSGESLSELGIKWLLIPTPDYSTPKIEDVERAVMFIDREVSAIPLHSCMICLRSSVV